MTLLELHNYIEVLLHRENNNNLIVAVPTQGLSGNHVKITALTQGFDWDSGLALLFPEKPLTTVSLACYSKVKDAYLRKISNLSKIERRETLNAKYKSKVFVGKDKWECLNWLNNCFNEEFGENQC